MRIVVPMDVPKNQLVVPVNARTLPENRRVRRPVTLFLPPWVSGKTDLTPSRDGGLDRPDSIVVHPDADDPDQLPTTIIGAGSEHQEDLLELGERLREEQRATKDERRTKKAAAAAKMLQRTADHIDRKLTHYKRNPVTAKDPKHVIPKEKQVF
jgi:hypothetical protein